MARSRHHTAWAGLLAVAAELSRRSYNASITLGNTPALDLICTSPAGVPFAVQVKSASTKTWVPIQQQWLEAAPRADLYLAVVFIPRDLALPPEFHILTQAEACTFYARQRRVRRNGMPYKPGWTGLAWADVSPSRSMWAKLPA